MTSDDSAKLFIELQQALSNATRAELSAWGRSSAARLPQLGKRRLSNLGRLATGVADLASSELSDAFRALQNGRFGAHAEQRAASGIDRSLSIATSARQSIGMIGRGLMEDPRKTAPGVLALALGFQAGSGGVDGDGGIPDLDLTLFGIGEHRSILTHSIIGGLVFEALILSVADLAELVCKGVPDEDRSPFWDEFSAMKDTIAQQLSTGASAGIAYHLGVDATLQPAAYHDLPVSMPIEAHQLLFALNAVAEGVDAAGREPTTGERVAGNVSDYLGAIGAGIKGFMGSGK